MAGKKPQKAAVVCSDFAGASSSRPHLCHGLCHNCSEVTFSQTNCATAGCTKVKPTEKHALRYR
jgi:hypothetical protein